MNGVNNMWHISKISACCMLTVFIPPPDEDESRFAWLVEVVTSGNPSFPDLRAATNDAFPLRPRPMISFQRTASGNEFRQTKRT